MILAKILLLRKSARTDILNGVAFLTARVRKNDNDEDKKLDCTQRYISGIRKIVLILESNGTEMVKW